MAKNKIDETFIKEQHTFTQHIRDPENAPAPEGIESRRISIYTDLIFRNIENFIANSFPVLRQVIMMMSGI